MDLSFIREKHLSLGFSMGYIYNIPSSDEQDESSVPAVRGKNKMNKPNPTLILLLFIAAGVGVTYYHNTSSKNIRRLKARVQQLENKIDEMAHLKEKNEQLAIQIVEKDHIISGLRIQLRTSSRLVKPGKEKEINFGLISAILFSEQNATVVVDDVILREGESIYGVTVKKIYRNEVEFESGGEKWRQRLREIPPKIWTRHLFK